MTLGFSQGSLSTLRASVSSSMKMGLMIVTSLGCHVSKLK